MARVEIPSTVQSGAHPVSGALVYVYLRGTTTQVPVYSAELGGTVLAQPLVTLLGRIEGWVDSDSSLDLAVSWGSNSYTERFEPASARSDYATLDTIDLRVYAASEAALYSSSGVSGSAFMTDAWQSATDEGKKLLLPPAPILITSPINLPVTNPRLIGRGRGLSVIRPHPDWLGGTPLITAPVAGGGTVATDIVLEDFTLDGNYHNSTEYLTRCALTAPYTYGDATITVDAIPAGFPASGATARAIWDDFNSDDQTFTYTSRSSTQFFGVVASGGGRNQIVGQELNWYPAGILGLFRIYAFTRMSVVRCDFINGPAYGFGLQGYYANANGPQSDLYVQDSRFLNNGSDGIDVKDLKRAVFIRSEASDNPDKGFNPRCQMVTMVECDAHRNQTGIGIDGKGGEADAGHFATLTVAATKTDTSMTFDDCSGMAAAGSGHIGVEEVDWTGNSGTVISGMTRGLRGTRAAVHPISSDSDVSVLVEDVDPSSVNPLFSDFNFSADLLGCHTDDNSGTGIALGTGGFSVNIRYNVFGGGGKGNNRGILIYGSNRGRCSATIHGGQYDDNGEGIRAQYVKSFSIFGTQISGSTGVNSNGDALYLLSCSNGGRVSGLDAKNNVGRPVRMAGNSDFFDIDGSFHGNAAGDTVLELGSNNRGSAFPRSRMTAGRFKVLLPTADGGPTPSTPHVWQNFLTTDIIAATIGALVDGTLELWPLWLPEGLAFTRLGILLGSTAWTGAQNSFMALYGDDRALLVQTPDHTTNVGAVSLPYDRPLTGNVTYTLSREGLYFFGQSIKATTRPTYAGRDSAITTFAPWRRARTSNTGLAGTAPNPAVPVSEQAGIPYIYFK